jgi:hypothetical protein
MTDAVHQTLMVMRPTMRDIVRGSLSPEMAEVFQNIVKPNKYPDFRWHGNRQNHAITSSLPSSIPMSASSPLRDAAELQHQKEMSAAWSARQY